MTIDLDRVRDVLTLVVAGGGVGSIAGGVLLVFVRTIVKREIRPLSVAIFGLRLGQSAIARGIGHLCETKDGSCGVCDELEDIEAKVQQMMREGGTP